MSMFIKFTETPEEKKKREEKEYYEKLNGVGKEEPSGTGTKPSIPETLDDAARLVKSLGSKGASISIGESGPAEILNQDQIDVVAARNKELQENYARAVKDFQTANQQLMQSNNMLAATGGMVNGQTVDAQTYAANMRRGGATDDSGYLSSFAAPVAAPKNPEFETPPTPVFAQRSNNMTVSRNDQTTPREQKKEEDTGDFIFKDKSRNSKPLNEVGNTVTGFVESWEEPATSKSFNGLFSSMRGDLFEKNSIGIGNTLAMDLDAAARDKKNPYNAKLLEYFPNAADPNHARRWEVNKKFQPFKIQTSADGTQVRVLGGQDYQGILAVVGNILDKAIDSKYDSVIAPAVHKKNFKNQVIPPHNRKLRSKDYINNAFTATLLGFVDSPVTGLW